LEFYEEVSAALSVVIPTRNRGGVVVRAIESVLANRRPDLEVVVVDDGSTDDTAARLAKSTDPRLQFHQIQSTGNANRARNIGARSARGDLIAFLDSDDTFGPDRVERLIRMFAERPDIDCLVDGFVERSRREIRFHRMPSGVPDGPLVRHMLIAHLIPLTNSAITVRREAFDAVNGYDEGMPRHQDRELLLRLARHHVIWLGDTTDVDKHRLRNSLSHQHDGYIVGLDALAARCPDYSLPENRDIFRYLVVRGIVKAIANGRWVAAAREVRQWTKAKHLPKDYLDCLRAYRVGKTRRIQHTRG
jgi:glycosyltransferase involved in cell wall biosynthesis